jgi:uncharacterized membrane protein YidH (DUF202 family)
MKHSAILAISTETNFGRSFAIAHLKRRAWEMSQQDDSTSARDHLANERTFLAWLRTGLALVVFGFTIGRFAIAIREFAHA